MKKCVLILMILLSLQLSFAATSSSELYGRLRSAYQDLSSFQADIKQSNYYPQLDRTISYSGKIYFTPGRMLMTFDQPNIQRLKIAQGRVELYDGSSNTLFKTEMLPEFGRMNPVEILQLYWARSSVSVTSEDSKTATVKLVPREDELINSLSATLNKDSGIVSKLSYTDNSGNSVSYDFTNIKINTTIPAAVWEFVYPPDLQVIEQ